MRLVPRVCGPLVPMSRLAHDIGIEEAERRGVEYELRYGGPPHDAARCDFHHLLQVGVARAADPEVAVEVQEHLWLFLELGSGVEANAGVGESRLGSEGPACPPTARRHAW